MSFCLKVSFQNILRIYIYILLYKVEFPLSRTLHISRHVTNSAHKSSTRVPSCNTLHFINETLDYCIPLFVLITKLSLIPIGPYIVYEKHVVLRFDLFLTPKKSSSALFRFHSSFFFLSLFRFLFESVEKLRVTD